MTRKRRAGIALTALGVCAAAAGAAGLTADRGPSAPAPSGPSASASATPAPVETPQRFLDELAQAMRSGDVDFMAARLAPAVIARFGDTACRAAVARFTDPTAAFIVIHVAPPAPYVYTTDTRSTTVPGTLAVTSDQTHQGTIMEVTVHLTPVGDQLRWFTDCSA